MSKYIVPIIGLILITINAISYIFDLDIKHPALTILGIIFIAIGMKKINKKS